MDSSLRDTKNLEIFWSQTPPARNSNAILRGTKVRKTKGRETAELTLGIKGKSDPENVKGTNSKSHFVLDKRDRKLSLKANIWET
jgi:hypothetical protein